MQGPMNRIALCSLDPPQNSGVCVAVTFLQVRKLGLQCLMQGRCEVWVVWGC